LGFKVAVEINHIDFKICMIAFCPMIVLLFVSVSGALALEIYLAVIH
jgi:hypothetical protein